jgi:DNA-binding protein H-NS
MARPRKSKSLASMSIDALLQMRDDVTAALARQAAALQGRLAHLTGTASAAPKRGRPKGSVRASKLTGRKVAAKYRDKSGNTWSGRGAQPRWMTAAIKAGAKRDDFLIAAPAKMAAKTPAKARKRKARR